jgi:hypothetical protein
MKDIQYKQSSKRNYSTVVSTDILENLQFA